MKTSLKLVYAVMATSILLSSPVTGQEKMQEKTNDKKEAVKETPKEEKQKNENEWPELKSFHQVMAQTFHPAEEGNLEPIKTRSAEMHEKATILLKSKAPASFNTPEIMTAARELETKTKDLHQMILGKASNEEITASITSAHDTFHKIIGLCKKEKGEHKHGAHDGHGH